ncbi:MAG: nucleotidyltransferase family protein [Bacteroidetes bacterium]|nr:nucleotidyltransferase family protein [Bacteroidota bacterium]
MGSPPQTCGIIVLAAGASTRLGQSKQLIIIGNKSLLHQTAETALSITSKVVVVLGSDFERHKAALEGVPVLIVENKNWSRGMGSSLKAGLQTILNRYQDLDEVIMMVCDQPLLNANHLQNLLATMNRTHSVIVASQYNGGAGVPAIFRKEVFQHLLTLDDESGAKQLFKQMKDHMVMIDFPGGDVDVDTPEDLQRLKERKGGL